MLQYNGIPRPVLLPKVQDSSSRNEEIDYGRTCLKFGASQSSFVFYVQSNIPGANKAVYLPRYGAEAFARRDCKEGGREDRHKSTFKRVQIVSCLTKIPHMELEYGSQLSFE
jgi:hypothetical protein